MATKKITKIISTENGDNYVADIEDIENRITQNSSNLETAKQELSNKCNEALSQAKAYTDTEKANLVKKSGDTLNGNYFFNDNCNLYKTNKNGTLRLNASNDGKAGARLVLCGKDNKGYPAEFNLCANDGTSDVQLIGKASGELYWNNKHIVRSVNSVNADANGNVQLGNVGAITGEIKWFAFNTVPDGYIICNGAKVSRTTYADLFAAIGTSFGEGDGSTTFDLPDLIDRFAQGSRTVGTYKSAGLPNITGGFWDLTSTIDTPTMGNADGVFFTNYTQEGNRVYSIHNTAIADSPYGNIDGIGFNASRSNAIYGKSTTVQPPALTLLPCIKY